MIDLLQSWKGHLLKGKALDIGAGDGEISLWLASNGFEVDALERDHGSAAILAQRIGSAPIRLHTLDVLDFQISEKEYTLIIASAVLHFIEPKDRVDLSQRLIAGLHPGGMLFAAALTIDDPAAGADTGDRTSSMVHFFAPGELRQLFQTLDPLFYEEARRSAPEATYGFRAGAEFVGRRPSTPGVS